MSHEYVGVNKAKRHARIFATGSATVWLALVGLMAWSSGCTTTQSKVHNADSKLAAPVYSNYRIVEPSVGTADADLAIQARIRQVMEARGYGEAEDAALLVTYKVLTVDSEKRAARAAGDAETVVAAADRNSVAIAPGDEDGKLNKLVLIQLLDAKSLRIVWVGWSQAEAPSEDLALRASDAASKILSRVPQRI